jgi:hypothetical protein
MVTMTLAIPEELKHKMDTFPEMNWSAVARAGIQERITMLEKFREFTKDSTMTEEDALELGRKVNMRVAKRYKKLMK